MPKKLNKRIKRTLLLGAGLIVIIATVFMFTIWPKYKSQKTVITFRGRLINRS